MKKLIVLLIILFFSSQMFGQISGKSKAGSLFSKKKEEKKEEPTVVTAPVISLFEPFVSADNQVAHAESQILLRGIINDQYGIEEFKINQQSVELTDENNFSFSLMLEEGTNFVVIEAVNSEDKSTRKEFRVVRQTNISTPQILVIEPIVNANREVIHEEKIITIRGKIRDSFGIKEITVNGSQATVYGDNEFFANVQLQDGINNVYIRAENMKDKFSEERFKVVTPIDLEGPQITLLEPQAQRGIKVIRKKDVLTIKGKVTDPSGISEVTVNNRAAKILANNEFSIQMFLAMGDNQIIIRAVDNKYNTSVDTFTVVRKLEEIIKAGKYIALIIGIDSYEGYWTPLKNAVNDAQSLANVLKNNYGFDEVQTLIDKEATRRNVIQKFEWLANNVSSDDNVLIFYAGHGQFNKTLNKGYWVPVDAKTKSVADYVSNNDVKTFLGGIPSKHTLLITDACFAGDIFRGSQAESIAFDPADMSRYYREVYRKPSRLALTSGSIEPVMDAGRNNHSIFSYFLLKALEDNDQKYLDTSQLFNEFRMAVANNSEQTPQLQVVRDTNDEGGQFIFIKSDD